MLNGTKKRSQVSCREYYSYKLQIGLFGFFVELHTILVLLQRPSKSWLYQSYHNGLPLHHDTKRGLDQTVKLLLSHGANTDIFPLCLLGAHVLILWLVERALRA
ncbi:uncharacterized protein LOC111405594 isoform X6 [Olea europaea var. sylvestris]|uniref:uncharacterized protein LOC111405594 isoform X6 n=1 Tax=Olea europaea var. sylvestris TaxID=158386 RepID=UPI000C1D5FF3|nr:uncharacterized protein LOC111405594 isoform X6 [Olea europaea var. sylvestris]